jgi:hypothetical protein
MSVTTRIPKNPILPIMPSRLDSRLSTHRSFEKSSKITNHGISKIFSIILDIEAFVSLCPHALFVLAVLLRLSRLSAHTQLRHLPQSSQAGCCGPGKVHWGFLTEPYEAGEFLWESVGKSGKMWQIVWEW